MGSPPTAQRIRRVQLPPVGLRRGMARLGTARHGKAWPGRAGLGPAWALHQRRSASGGCNSRPLVCGLAWQGPARRDAARRGVARHGTAGLGPARQGMAWVLHQRRSASGGCNSRPLVCGRARHGLARPGSARRGRAGRGGARHGHSTNGAAHPAGATPARWFNHTPACSPPKPHATILPPRPGLASLGLAWQGRAGHGNTTGGHRPQCPQRAAGDDLQIA
jgi:hypothetical protein